MLGTYCRAFANEVIAPHAAAIDRGESYPRSLISDLAAAGWIGASLAQGRGLSMAAYGLMTEELGRTCGSTRNLVAVEDMVAGAIARWGTDEQRARWIGPILNGDVVAAFALTEPGVGSDAASITTTATVDASGHFVLDGSKTWISFAAIADLFLVFAKLDGKHTAFLLEAGTPGLEITPIYDLLGLRGSALATLTLRGCRVSAANIVGRPGFGLIMVATHALDLGRYSTAWGCVGLAQACLEASAARTTGRTQGGVALREHQLVRAMLADLVTETTAARALCERAGAAKDRGDPDASNITLMAKYFASGVAARASTTAVQLHGAAGIGGVGGVERHFRDAKVMEIIEGTTQIQQLLLSGYAVRVGSSRSESNDG